MDRAVDEHLLDPEFNLELYVCTEILDLPSLHFGLWEDGEPLTLDNMRAAQRRYTERLVAHVPAAARTALDVGCGIGDVARALAARGIDVTAISPDAHHERVITADPTPGVTFRRSKLEDFESDTRFDLVLMSESQNYFSRQAAFSACDALLEPGGHLLVCGMFRTGDAFTSVTHARAEFVAGAAAAGLHLVRETDITPQALGTVRFGEKIREEVVEPALHVARVYARRSSPWKARLLQWFLKREMAGIESILDYYRAYSDPDHFVQNVQYLTLLFERRSD